MPKIATCGTLNLWTQKLNEKSVQPPLLQQPVEQPPQQYQQHQRPLRYNFKFNGHCFYCGIFGHRIANCFKKKNVELRFSRMTNMNHNKFECLSSKIECPKCSNFGHTTNNCRLDIQRSYQTNWVRQGSQSHLECYECNLAIQKVERDKIPWYVDSGCSKHLQTW